MTTRQLSERLQKKAQLELNESSIPENLRRIREWLKKQPHLHIRTDDQWLLSFLRGCKFSLQGVKEKLDYFYTIRSLIPEYFEDRDPFSPEIQEILEAGCVIPFPKTNGELGPRIVAFGFWACNFDTMPLTRLIKVYLMILDILMLEDDDFMISGTCIFVDYRNTPMSFLMQYTPGVIKKTILCVQQAYPIRIKSIYCINILSVFETTLDLVKSLMKKKIRERMHVYSANNLYKIYDQVSREIIPNEFGGRYGPHKEIATYWKKKVESYREWFLQDRQFGTNENKRIGLPKTTAELFGLEGSFRSLNID